MKTKTALILGISGQDGSYLADFLLKKKYRVFGVTRDNSKRNLKRLIKLEILKKINFFKKEDISFTFIKKIYRKIGILEEIYFLSGETSPIKSIDNPIQTFDSNVKNLVTILEFIRLKKKKTKIFYASSSEIFENSKKNIFNENSKIGPRTPYGISKAAGLWLIKFYRNYHNVFCSCGILFNHESPLRSNKFVFKKIIEESKKIKQKKGSLSLGDISVKRDIGWAPDYVQAMWKMLQLKKSIDLVIGSGKAYSIKEFLNFTIKSLELDKNKILINKKKLIRKADIKEYKSNTSLAKKKLSWKNSLGIKEIVNKMINNEYY